MEKSNQINELAKALVKFQQGLEPIKHDSENTQGDYTFASLNQILKSIRPKLIKCGLTITQFPSGTNGLLTLLLHSSGEYIMDTHIVTPENPTPQGVGSAITYQRRQAISSVLSLNIESESESDNKPTKKSSPVTASDFQLSDHFFQMILARINKGETDLLEKAKSIFTISETQKKVLQSAIESYNQKT